MSVVLWKGCAARKRSAKIDDRHLTASDTWHELFYLRWSELGNGMTFDCFDLSIILTLAPGGRESSHSFSHTRFPSGVSTQSFIFIQSSFGSLPRGSPSCSSDGMVLSPGFWRTHDTPA